MNLFSFTFAFFIGFALLVYYLVPRKFQWICIFAANTFFYFYSGVWNLVFVAASSAISFFAAQVVGKFNESVKARKAELSKEEFKAYKNSVLNRKRLVLVLMLLLDIGLLFYLKYWRVLVGAKTLFLPLAISYYTLQTISYFMDVYNSKYGRETNFLRYFIYVSFFPQFLMGPINRYDNLGKQFREEHPFDFENIKHGVMLILYGCLKKFLIADMLVKRISDILDPNFSSLPGNIIVFGILMYSAYQYADFSGGIDIVLGVAELFGIKMQPNFRQPYFATSLADFWRRWHISLGLWMKDYVFYPLSFTKKMNSLGKFASRFGKHFGRVLPACIANIIVFVLVGIWHGPELHFLIWGLYNGLVIALSDMFKPVFEDVNKKLHIDTESRWFHIFRIVRTFVIVNIGWYFDRIVDVKKSFVFLKNTFVHFGGILPMLHKSYWNDVLGKISNFESQIILVAIGCAIVFVVSVLKENKVDVWESIKRRNIAFRWACYYVPLILVILSLTFTAGDTGFMYAQY
ncbi:MAG: MBOAT family protein [Treponema sp.]|nr:MBOAT family protein [Treponema sp.]